MYGAFSVDSSSQDSGGMDTNVSLNTSVQEEPQFQSVSYLQP